MIDWLRRHWFTVSAALLLGILTFNIGRYHRRMAVWAKSLFHRDVVVDVGCWQAWADANAGFFAPLAQGVCVALVGDPADYGAAVLSKNPGGIRVEKSSFFSRRKCAIYFVMDAPTATTILSVRVDQGNPFWDTWKRLARSGALQVYTFGSPGELQTNGVATFLRSFDVRPVHK